MARKIERIDSIRNMAVFQDFLWKDSVKEKDGSISELKSINVIYGRNYSGKTTLSRIVRAMETGVLSDKYEAPSFSIKIAGGKKVTESDLASHGEKVRVFNEDFVKDNLRFIANPDDNVEPFAILGEDNNKIETEIKALETEVGSKEEGSETGLYANLKAAKSELFCTSQEHDKKNGALDKQLGDKATDRKSGIKYNPERFGDQNYNIQKLRSDIENVKVPTFQRPTSEQLKHCENLILEKKLKPIQKLSVPCLTFSVLTKETEALVTKKISGSDKVEYLVKDAVLNRWVSEGQGHHKGKRENCAFCGSKITEERWRELERHFDEESDQLERDIDQTLAKVESEKIKASSALTIIKNQFYSKFHGPLDEIESDAEDAVNKYGEALNSLGAQLVERKNNILNPALFLKSDDASRILQAAWQAYEEIRVESELFTDQLSAEQEKSKETLRLKEVSDYLVSIGFEVQLSNIKDLKEKLDGEQQKKDEIEDRIGEIELLISAKKRELNDEEKGAKKVNEYLNNFFGHQLLSLEAKKDESIGQESKRIKFEVVRDGKKAYHLSEGECSLLAFCYFLAKLGDVDTSGSKPIIWIDDPISSLDGNHVFFVYSLIDAEIVSSDRFNQLFISTHNLDFLKYLKRLKGTFIDSDGKKKDYQKGYFVVVRRDKVSTVEVMPKYLKEYVTEFNYLFHQIYKCANIESIDDENYVTFYNFGNNARKFFEIFLYYKYPDQGMTEETLMLFFGEESIPAVLTGRINNEYSHLSAVFERGATPVEVPEMRTAARQIMEGLKEDQSQFAALLKSVGVAEVS